MEENNYIKIFEELGIDVLPIGENYTPDLYAREIIADVNIGTFISYSNSTMCCLDDDEQIIK